MKKKLFISLIFFLLCVKFYTLDVLATSIPFPTSPTYSIVGGGAEDLLNSYLANHDIVGYDTSSIDGVIFLLQDVINSESDLYKFDSEDVISVSPVTEEYYNFLCDLSADNLLYDVDGNSVTIDDCYLVELDNGFFSSVVYVDENGNILKSLKSMGGNFDSLSALCLGGHTYSADDWESLCSSIAQQVDDDNFSVPLTENATNQSLYLWIGYKTSGKIYNSSTLYFPTIYNPPLVNFVVENGMVRRIAFNDGCPYINNVLKGSNGFSISNNVAVIDGVEYAHSFFINQAQFKTLSSVTYDQWLSGQGSGTLCFSNTGFYIDDVSATKGSRRANFKYINENVNTIGKGSAYSVGALSDYVDTLLDSGTANTSFDGNDSVSAVNYPLVTSIADEVIGVTSLPIEDTIVSPVVPETIPTDNVIPDSQIANMNIPLIQNLERRFPFSIPFDIYHLLNGLSVTREVPHFEFTINFPIINYEWDIVLDLTMWDDIATLFRVLFLILFIIGLAIFSYSHFFGS